MRGIIPAYAGSTPCDAIYTPTEMDHPRIRGEHSTAMAQPVPSPGSSPHTRGAPEDWLDLAVPIGIIPAYAGSTFDSEFLCGPGTDHPRIRGEHAVHRVLCDKLDGSSPHTRGALSRTCRRAPGWRIIPAYAGSTGFVRH